MNKEIVRIVIDLVAFLALSDDDIVDPDSAMEQLEHVAAIMKKLSVADRQEFLSLLMTHAQDAQLSGDHERFEFLTNLPDRLGI